MTTSILSTVDTSHEDLIHDAVLDYYGLRLATCSSDRSVKIFDAQKQILIEDLRRHEGPVWQVAWSHPMFGNYLASCSYDKRVIIWKEMSSAAAAAHHAAQQQQQQQQQTSSSSSTTTTTTTTQTPTLTTNSSSSTNKWTQFYEYAGHESSVNTVAWAPSDYGLVFACGSSDGSISIVSLSGDGNWHARKIENAHPTGVTSVSWAPAFPQYNNENNKDENKTSGGSVSSGAVTISAKRIVSGGCDNTVKIWREDVTGQWILDQSLVGHNEWVRDVAWSQNIIHSKTNIASCSQSGKVLIWSCDLTDTGNNSALSMWKSTTLHEFNVVAWHVSWSLTSNMLAISTGDNKVTIWKEDHNGKYVCINDDKLLSNGKGGDSSATTTTAPPPQQAPAVVDSSAPVATS